MIDIVLYCKFLLSVPLFSILFVALHTSEFDQLSDNPGIRNSTGFKSNLFLILRTNLSLEIKETIWEKYTWYSIES